MNMRVFPPPTPGVRGLVAHAFIDGGYLRAVGKGRGTAYEFPHPWACVNYVIGCIRDMGGRAATIDTVLVRRTSFYDAVEDANPNSTTPEAVQRYWDFIEGTKDTELGMGKLRRGANGRRVQKGVDVMLACDMLVGAFHGIFDVAILIAGDADFVPLVYEVKRRGVSVVVGADAASTAPDLRAAADRFIDFRESFQHNIEEGPFQP
jgi:uncharacterized LabA/DUF88 family protein